MTLSASRDRNVGLQSPQRRGFGDVDMTSRALRDVLFLLAAAVVHELRRDPRRLGDHVRRSRQLVTTVAVVRHRLLRFPVTVEARRMIFRHCFETFSACRMTDRAVVVVLRCVRET